MNDGIGVGPAVKLANAMVMVFVDDYVDALKNGDKEEIIKHKNYLKLPSEARGKWWDVICETLGYNSEIAAKKLLTFLEQIDKQYQLNKHNKLIIKR